MTQTTQDEIEKIVSMLLKAAQAEHMKVTADQRIGEDDAAKLLQLSPRTLSAYRKDKIGPPFYTIPAGRSRFTYGIADLAGYVLSRRKQT